MYAFEIEALPDQTRLGVRGDISIQNAQECLEAFRDFQSSGNRLQLDLDGVTGADISFLQLICSLHRTCLNAGRHLTIKGTMPETFKSILETSGFRRQTGCKYGGDNPCLCSWRDAT